MFVCYDLYVLKLIGFIKNIFCARKLNRTYAIGVIPVKLVPAEAGNGNPGL